MKGCGSVKRDELYSAAIKKYGYVSQIHMLLEEMSELQKVVLKDIRNGTISFDEFIDEAADVEITLEQVKKMYGVGNKVSKRKKYKKERLLQRMNPLTVKQVLENIQRRYKKKKVGDDIAVVIQNSEGDELGVFDCGEVGGLGMDALESLLVERYSIEPDYYQDGSNKKAIIIDL
jgi:NTP pyrophosphatase (non-canonical NTP hydrolase)